MADKSAIEWTDATWSPIRAIVKQDAAYIAQEKGYTSLVQIAEKMAGHVGPHCEHASHGCNNCYAETNNHRCLPANGTGLPFDRRSRDLVDVFVDQKILEQPLRWKRGRRIFVENQSDLFGEWVPFELIDQVFTTMVAADWHTYQILTKRAKRMFEYFASGRHDGGCGPDRATYHLDGKIWLGVSAEDQQRADERIPWLLKTPAAVRFVSYEPALGPVDFGRAVPCGYYCDESVGHVDHGFWTPGINSGIHWVIVGGESGPGARPFNIDWARSVIEQCRAAGTACFVKQLGAKPYEIVGCGFHYAAPRHSNPVQYMKLKDRKGGNMDEWAEDLRVRKFPAVAMEAIR